MNFLKFKLFLRHISNKKRLRKGVDLCFIKSLGRLLDLLKLVKNELASNMIIRIHRTNIPNFSFDKTKKKIQKYE